MQLTNIERVVGWSQLLLELAATLYIGFCRRVVVVVTDDVEHRKTECLQARNIVVEQRHIHVNDVAEHQSIDVAVGDCSSLLAHIAIEVITTV